VGWCYVPGQHDQLGLRLVDQRGKLGLGGGLGVRGDRDAVERQPIGRRQVAEVLVIGRHGGDVHRERARLPAKEQVIQAVPEPGDHEQCPDPLMRLTLTVPSQSRHVPRHKKS
jgi:hypothetical protein